VIHRTKGTQIRLSRRCGWDTTHDNYLRL